MFRLVSILTILFTLSLPIYVSKTSRTSSFPGPAEPKPEKVEYGPTPMCGKKTYRWCY
jgi:hypothetical protein